MSGSLTKTGMAPVVNCDTAAEFNGWLERRLSDSTLVGNSEVGSQVRDILKTIFKLASRNELDSESVTGIADRIHRALEQHPEVERLDWLEVATRTAALIVSQQAGQPGQEFPRDNIPKYRNQPVTSCEDENQLSTWLQNRTNFGQTDYSNPLSEQDIQVIEAHMITLANVGDPRGPRYIHAGGCEEIRSIVDSRLSESATEDPALMDPELKVLERLIPMSIALSVYLGKDWNRAEYGR